MRISSRTVIDYLYIIIGSAVTAFAVAVFLNPAKLAPGGVSGIATILYHLFGWDLGTAIFALTVPVFLIGLKLFGKQYGFRTLLGSVLLSALTSAWVSLLGENGILDYSKDMSILLSALYGGVLSGVGIGMVMKSGSNTGGTDIIAQIIARYTPLSLGTALFIVDGVIIAVSAFFFGIGNALYATAVAYITTVVINKIVLSMGTIYAKTVFIISDNYREIGQFIIAKLTRAVHKADSGAFMVISETYHVLGEGYTPIEHIADTSDVTQQ